MQRIYQNWNEEGKLGWNQQEQEVRFEKMRLELDGEGYLFCRYWIDAIKIFKQEINLIGFGFQ